MKIALDISHISDNNFLQHRVRGAGFYVNNLISSLRKYFPQNEYLLIERGQKFPKNTDLAHYPYFEPFFLTLPWRQPVKTVVTVHDLTPLVFPDQFPKGLKGEIKWQRQKLVLKNAAAIIADSFSSKKDIAKFTSISLEKIFVVYLAQGEEFRRLEAENWKLEIRKKYNLPEKFVLYVGDVTWNKNLPRLVRATGQVKLPLVMVGKALVDMDFDKNNFWSRDLIEVQNLTKNNPEIICLGFVPTDDLVKIYNLATVFAMPSIYEGFGLPVLEAMSCGVPVVASQKGSLPEVAGNAAYFVDPLSIDDIAKGIQEVINSEKLAKQLSKKGLLRAASFSWEKTAGETIKVYKKVYKKVLSIKY